jgi:hypothetical protein
MTRLMTKDNGLYRNRTPVLSKANSSQGLPAFFEGLGAVLIGTALEVIY